MSLYHGNDPSLVGEDGCCSPNLTAAYPPHPVALHLLSSYIWAPGPAHWSHPPRPLPIAWCGAGQHPASLAQFLTSPHGTKLALISAYMTKPGPGFPSLGTHSSLLPDPQPLLNPTLRKLKLLRHSVVVSATDILGMLQVTNRARSADHVMPSSQKLPHWRKTPHVRDFVMCPCLSELGHKGEYMKREHSAGLRVISQLWVCLPLKH